jgi:hypothetical protein
LSHAWRSCFRASEATEAVKFQRGKGAGTVWTLLVCVVETWSNDERDSHKSPVM